MAFIKKEKDVELLKGRDDILTARMKRALLKTKTQPAGDKEDEDAPSRYAEGSVEDVVEDIANDVRSRISSRDHLWRYGQKPDDVDVSRADMRNPDAIGHLSSYLQKSEHRGFDSLDERRFEAQKKHAIHSVLSARKENAGRKTVQNDSSALDKVTGFISSAAKKAAGDIRGFAGVIAAGAVVLVVVVAIICAIGIISGSPLGIFLSGEDSGSGRTMQSVVREINEEYQERIGDIKAAVEYDELDLSGSSAVWREILSVYAVYSSTGPDAIDVASIDEDRIAILREIFWKMNDITSSAEIVPETVEIEDEDENGEPITRIDTVEKTVLHILVSHKTAFEIARDLAFDNNQITQLTELLSEGYNSLWAAVLYGIHDGDTAIVNVAESQISNVGGEPYWSWYGFTSRVEWCSCFVSWCANECGYIDAGTVPMHADPQVAVNWYKARNQWLSGSSEPVPGMLIFFDWDNKGRSGDQDGYADHIGIVEKVEDGWVFTIEGNTADSVDRRRYEVGHYEVMGYGTTDKR